MRDAGSYICHDKDWHTFSSCTAVGNPLSVHPFVFSVYLQLKQFLTYAIYST